MGFILLGVFGLAFIVFLAAAWWKIFEKAGRQGWEGIVPFYNFYILLKIVGKPGWWLILFLIPYVNLIWIIWTYNMLSKSFGKDEGFTVGLCLLSVVFFPILGFGDARYLGPYGDPLAFKQATMPQFDFDQP